MTIKKRLFISNILMLVIPAVLAVLALAAGVLAFFATSLPDSGYRLVNRHELDETRAELTALAGEWLDGGSGTAARLESLCSRNSMCLIIESGGRPLRRPRPGIRLPGRRPCRAGRYGHRLRRGVRALR